jgi:hypothetical protein
VATSHLSVTVDTWTIQAVVASRYLLRLYRGLGDGKQALTASQAGAQAEERAQRLGLTSGLAALQQLFVEKNPETTEAEAEAWKTLVEAQAGICAFHSMVNETPKGSSGLQGSRTRAAKAFCRSIQGYRVAFPEQIADEGIAKALELAAEKCTEACLKDLGCNEGVEERSTAAEEIHSNIRDALWDAAGLSPQHEALF